MKAWGERKSQGYQCWSYLKFWHFVGVASLHWLFFFRTIASKPDLIWLPSFLELPFGIQFQTRNTPWGSEEAGTFMHQLLLPQAARGVWRNLGTPACSGCRFDSCRQHQARWPLWTRHRGFPKAMWIEGTSPETAFWVAFDSWAPYVLSAFVFFFLKAVITSSLSPKTKESWFLMATAVGLMALLAC